MRDPADAPHAPADTHNGGAPLLTRTPCSRPLIDPGYSPAMRRASPLALLFSAASLLACHPAAAPEPGDAPDERPLPPASNVLAAPPAPAPPPRPQIRSCPVAGAPTSTVEIHDVVHLIDLDGVGWFVGNEGDRAGPTPVLIHLGAAGELVRTPLPFWSETVADEGHALRFADADGKRWVVVDLHDPEAPLVGPVTAAPALAPHAKGFASDGTIAAFARYYKGDAADAYIGDTFPIDLASGRRGAAAPWTAWELRCRRGRCFGLASANADASAAALIEVDPRGATVRGDLGPWTCTGAVTWEAGDRWHIGRSDPAGVSFASLDLTTGAFEAGPVAPLGACPGLAHVRHAGEDLVIAEPSGTATAASLQVVTAEGALGPLTSLPPFVHREHVLAALDDGVAFADFSADRGMMHSPTDSRGVRRYYHVWSFKGRAGFLTRGADGWSARDLVDLPASGDEGDFATGYRVHLLARPGRAAALVVGDAGLPTHLRPLRQPCG